MADVDNKLKKQQYENRCVRMCLESAILWFLCMLFKIKCVSIVSKSRKLYEYMKIRKIRMTDYTTDQ